MKKKYSLKKSFLSEQEQAPDKYPQQMADFAPVTRKPISLDQIVDRYIVRYERESVPLEGDPAPGPTQQGSLPGDTGFAMEAAQLRKLVNYLLEQEAPPAEELPPEEDAGRDAPPDLDFGDMGGDTGEGGDEPAPEGPPVMNTPKINLNDFGRSVARLLNNFDALLNPKTIILNRVNEYIKTNYNDRTAKQFMLIMEQNYGVHPTNTDPSDDNSDFPTPYSGGALISTSGGSSGA